MAEDAFFGGVFKPGGPEEMSLGHIAENDDDLFNKEGCSYIYRPSDVWKNLHNLPHNLVRAKKDFIGSRNVCDSAIVREASESELVRLNSVHCTINILSECSIHNDNNTQIEVHGRKHSLQHNSFLLNSTDTFTVNSFFRTKIHEMELER